MVEHTYFIQFDGEPLPDDFAETIPGLFDLSHVFHNSAVFSAYCSHSQTRFLLEKVYPEKSFVLCSVKAVDRHVFKPYDSKTEAAK